MTRGTFPLNSTPRTPAMTRHLPSLIRPDAVGLNDRFAQVFADLGPDERLDPFAPRQAQPERPAVGLDLDGEAEEGTAEPFEGDEPRGPEQRVRPVSQPKGVPIRQF